MAREHRDDQRYGPARQKRQGVGRTAFWKVAGALVVVGSASIFNGAESYAQQRDFRAAAAAKAAAGREARTHAAISVPRPSAVGTFTTFDVPGAVNGLVLSAPSMAGAITGSYFDANFVLHGFLRASNGIIATFDVPGAVNGTFASGINPKGAITGLYFDVNSVAHGFLRTTNGAFTTFDVTGAVNGTFPQSINPEGVIIGGYQDANFVAHGFLRTRNGAITTFDPPGSTFTVPVAIEPQGVIVGTYQDANFVGHGFLRASNGAITTFDVTGAVNGTFPQSINPEGAITGDYFLPISGNPFGGNFRGFVRAPDGTFATFDAATYPPCCIFSFPNGITPAGVITGSFNDGFNINHGFLRASDGTITTFDAPGAGTGNFQGTLPSGITPGGEIVGSYIDTNNLSHGFIFIPQPSPLSAKR
jgi:predicted membrane protein